MSDKNTKPSFKWWLEIIIAVLSAIAGMVTENTTNFLNCF